MHREAGLHDKRQGGVQMGIENMENAEYGVDYDDYDFDNGQETITALITTTCAILISVLCCQNRMNLGLIILTGVGSLLGDVIILYSNQTRFNHRVFPFFVLATICVSNIQSETYIKMGIIGLTALIVVLYATYFYRAVIKEKILEKNLLCIILLRNLKKNIRMNQSFQSSAFC